MLYNIDVIVVGPGAIATPIWDKAEQVDLTPYEKTDYLEAAKRIQKYMVQNGKRGYPPEKVGEVVWNALTTPKPRLRYAVVPGNPVRNFIQGLLPKRMVDNFIARNLGFK
jgi:short-subunit dehydrogenase